jgi:hypothetical protein
MARIVDIRSKTPIPFICVERQGRRPHPGSFQSESHSEISRPPGPCELSWKRSTEPPLMAQAEQRQ